MEGLDSHWQSDLMDMVSLAQYNEELKYLMIITDLFSSYLLVQPFKSKRENDIAYVLTELQNQTGQKPKCSSLIPGQNTKKHKVKALLMSHSITQLFTHKDTKLSYAELAST